jgi:prepilin-type N-terminal cleavage/methylation domain-containing protein
MTDRRRAFTLIELLVVIAIISVLMTILLPGLASARRQARATVGMANLRSLSQMMFVYTNDHKDDFLNPFRVDDTDQLQPSAAGDWSDAIAIGQADQPGSSRLSWRFQSSNPQFNTEFFAYYWYSYLAEWRANGSGRVTDEMFSPADGDLLDQARALRGRGETLNGLMLWPSSFLYSPTFWSDSERFGGAFTASTGSAPSGAARGPMTRSQIRTSATSSVSSPSAKVMLFERADFFQARRVEIRPGEAVTSDKSPAWNNPRARTTVALADGNITQAKIGDLTRQAAGGQNELLPAGTGAPGDGMPLIPPRGRETEFEVGGSPSTADGDYPLFFWATRNGVKGRDLPR